MNKKVTLLQIQLKKKGLKFYLASSSPRRKKILKSAGLDAHVIRCTYEEKHNQGTNAKAVALKHAKRKLAAVVIPNRSQTALIVSADTLVSLDRHILGKPKNNDGALEMFRNLSGRRHSVFTAVAMGIWDGSRFRKKSCFVSRTFVTIRAMSTDQIKAYHKRIHPLDKAGAYAIQSKYSKAVIDKFQGSIHNAAGFPLEDFLIRAKHLLARVPNAKH